MVPAVSGSSRQHSYGIVASPHSLGEAGAAQDNGRPAGAAPESGCLAVLPGQKGRSFMILSCIQQSKTNNGLSIGRCQSMNI
jgi:hypothetical protein